MTPIQRKRVKRFTSFLSKIPPKNFNIFHVVLTLHDSQNIENIKPGSCGTVACALGYLPIYNPKVFEYYFDKSSKIIDVRIKNTNITFVDVAQEYFGFAVEDLELFFPDGYNVLKVTPKMVAGKIMSILQKGKK